MILNEYALVMGIITINDVMITLMGDLIGPGQEEQIVVRDENSWLVEGGTPIEDVMRILDIDDFPDFSNYETIAGFMMYRLRRMPKRTDYVKYAGYKFEVVDIDNYKLTNYCNSPDYSAITCRCTTRKNTIETAGAKQQTKDTGH